MERLKAAFASVYEIAPVKRRRGNQSMRGGRIRGWRRVEWPLRGIAADTVDPIWNTSHLSKGVPTSRCVAIGAPIRRPRDLEGRAYPAADLYVCKI